MPLLELENIFCGYGKETVIKGISLTVNEGEILSLAGANGRGKTTLLRAACGLLPIRSGSVRIDGRNIAEIPVKERACLTALLSQTGTGGDYSEYTVLETVLMGRYARQSGGIFSGITEDDRKIAEKCISGIGLGGLEERLITELSGGQLQRVFLARAFAQEPKIIFLDEPANHLDIKHQAELFGILQNWKKQGRAAVGVFHDIGFAAAVSDRMVLMDKGKAVLSGTPADVLASDRLSDVFETDVKAYMKKLSSVWS